MQVVSSCFRRVSLLATVILAACASPVPQRSGEWIEPTLGANSGLLRGEKVLVACEAWDISMQQNCQDWLSSQLRMRGANPVVARFENTPASGGERDGRLMADAQSIGARTVLVVALTPAVVGGGGFSGASIGIGGFSWGRGGGGGIGLSAPIGGSGWGGTGFAAQGRITDVSNSRLVWSTTFVSSPSADFAAQVRDLTGSVVDAAQSAGLL
ncbi:hypothetical protein [Variovorax sp. GT1P44]|uniref:hypothetical protein n=1 Tax=Variovorax sp. GT1P44 TaxID=3443742 RepID=UPI003F461415